MKIPKQSYLVAIVLLNIYFWLPDYCFAQSCEVGDKTTGRWVDVTKKFGACTPPVPVYNPEPDMAGTAYGGNYKVVYSVSISNGGGCGYYGNWGSCDRGCSDRRFICPIGNEIATGSMASYCQGNCSGGFSYREKVYESPGCCVFKYQTSSGESRCSYLGLSQFIRYVYEWVCNDCIQKYTDKLTECNGKPVINWNNETCEGECAGADPCQSERDRLIHECGEGNYILTASCIGWCTGQNDGPPDDDPTCN